MSGVSLMLDPDESPMGFVRERPVSEYPRRFVTLVIPIASPHYAELTLPARMAPREWEALVAFLAIACAGIVEETT